MRNDGGDRPVVWFQRVENGALAVLAAWAFVHVGFAWWWLLVLFLLFDVSAVGYLHSARLGAWTYNSVHSYIGPALLGVAGLVSGASEPAFLGLAWAFHIAVDRLLGYGLKLQEHFRSTHLGVIGRGPTP